MPNTPKFLSNFPSTSRPKEHVVLLAIGRGGFPNSCQRAVDYSPVPSPHISFPSFTSHASAGKSTFAKMTCNRIFARA